MLYLTIYSYRDSFIHLVQNDQPGNWIWKANLAFGGQTGISDNGIKNNDPQFEKQNDGLLFPTSKTPKTELPGIINERLSVDLFGEKWKAKRSVGAIQYPMNATRNLPLTEEMVGANAIK